MKRIIILLIVFQFFIFSPLDTGKGKPAQKTNASNFKVNQDEQTSNIDKNQYKDNLVQKGSGEGKSEIKSSGQSASTNLPTIIITSIITAFFALIINLIMYLIKENRKEPTKDSAKSGFVSSEAFTNLSDKFDEFQKCKICSLYLSRDRLIEAIDEFNKNNFKLAEIYINDELFRNPNHANTWVGLAEIYMEFNRLNEAVSSIDRAIELDKHEPKLNGMGQLHKIKAEILMRSGKYYEAEDLLENKVLSVNPNYKKARNLLKKCKKKIKYGDKRIDRITESVIENYLVMGNQELENGNVEQAEIYYKQEILNNKGHVNARVGLARTYLSSGKLRDALKTIDEAISLDQKNPRFNNMGQISIIKAEILMHSGKYEEAHFILEKILNSNPYYRKTKRFLNESKSKLKEKDKSKSRKKK